jgi:hypothetical protein
MNNIGIISSSVVALVAVVGLIWTYFKEWGEVKGRLTSLETKIEPFWKFVNESIPDMLIKSKGNPEPLSRRDELLIRYRDGTILPHEKDELLRILEAEREQAKKERDTALLILLGLLILALIASKK